MKKFYSLVLVVLSVGFTFARPVIKAKVGNGLWRSASTWNLHRIPANKDTVVIPANMIVTIDDVENLSSASLYVEVYGGLVFSKGKLWLNDNSTVIIYAGGYISGTGKSSGTLRIDGTNKFRSRVDGIILGPAYADATTGVAPNGFKVGMIVALPVKFLGFSVTGEAKGVLVEWATAEETNSDYYEVQRSENGNDWYTVGRINGAGNSTASHSYSYTDKSASALVEYYRIRQVDMDGQFAITPVRMLKNQNGNGDISLNAVSNSIYVHFPQQAETSVMINVTSISGQVVSQQMLNRPIGQVVVPVRNEMTGIYVITVTDGQSLKISKQVLL